MTLRTLARLLGGWLALLAIACAYTYARHAMWPLLPPNRAGSRWALATIEAAIAHRDAPPPPASASSYLAAGPVFVMVWRGGAPVFRHVGGTRFVDAVRDAARAVSRESLDCPAPLSPTGSEPHRDLVGCHVVIEVTTARAPATTHVLPLLSMSFAPGVDGVGIHQGDFDAYLTVDEMTSRGFYAGGRNFLVSDMTFGIDAGRVLGMLAREIGTDFDELRATGSVERLRMHRIARHQPPGSARVGARALRAAALDGAGFLLRHQSPEGQYTYIYQVERDAPHAASDYSWPRHAGATYFLSQAWRLFHHAPARDGAMRAIRYARRFVRQCTTEAHAHDDPVPLCLADGARPDLGSTALLAAAVGEYLRANEDPDARRMLVGLIAFVHQQQRADGEFMHEFDLRTSRPVDVQYLYYSGEAVLSLVKAYTVLRRRADLDAARRAMTHLSGAAWSFLGSRYYYGEEHWTCIAAGEAYPHIRGDDAYDFCQRWAEWTRRVQFERGQTPYDAAGAYGFGPLLTPRTTPVASRSEAFISTYELGRRRGIDDPALRTQIERGLAFMLRRQYRPGLPHLFARPDRAWGGLPGSAIDLDVRNDYIQHSCSAMSRWSEILTHGVAGDRVAH